MSSFQQPSSEESGAAAAPMTCAAGCGYFGSPATLGLCSVCFKKHSVLADIDPALASSTPAASASSKPAAAVATDVTTAMGGVSIVPAASANKADDGVAEPNAAAAQRTARCAACRKKVGLVTGFTCRCGSTFCGVHRHAEDHGCAFDFKAAGRAAVARDNPVVKGDKMPDKI